MERHEVSRVSWKDCGEYWDADYVVNGQHTPLMIHKSIAESPRFKFGSPEFWDYVERSAISAWESWRDHPEWRIN
jgi:hypothetical protein